MLTVDLYAKSDFYFFVYFPPELLQWTCIIFKIRNFLNEDYYYKEFVSNIHGMRINQNNVT